MPRPRVHRKIRHKARRIRPQRFVDGFANALWRIPASRIPLGVDIVEWKKAKAFYETHRGRLGSFLTAQERRFVENGRKPYEALAMIFAAKEAVFKALGASWMGTDGFRRIKVRPVSSKTFSYRPSRGKALRITFKKSSRHVLACCAP